MFHLSPPPPAQLEQPSSPLPKITLTGITTIAGAKRALLKVEFPAKPPEPLKHRSYMLAEGKHDGPIGVLAINEKTARVKVDNCGTVMEITFEKPAPTPPKAEPPTQASIRSRWARPPRLPAGLSGTGGRSGF